MKELVIVILQIIAGISLVDLYNAYEEPRGARDFRMAVTQKYNWQRSQ